MMTLQMTEEELKEVFKAHGLTVTILGCGCCGSPDVKVTYQGRVFEESSFCLWMHKEDNE